MPMGLKAACCAARERFQDWTETGRDAHSAVPFLTRRPSQLDLEWKSGEGPT